MSQPTATTSAYMDSYVAALQAHDWVRAGRESLEAIQQAQRLIDRDFAVWNTWAPEGYRTCVAANSTMEAKDKA